MLGASRAGFLGAAGSGGAFDPSSIAGLLFWHDGGLSGKTYHSGSIVSQWSDLSGNGVHWTQATDTLAPEDGTRTVNGIPALNFDGTEWAGLGSGDGITDTVHLFGVFIVDTHATTDYFFEAGAISNSNGFHIRMTSTANQIEIKVATGAATDEFTLSSAYTAPTAGFLLQARIAGSGTFGLKTSGVTEATATASSGGMTNPLPIDLFGRSSSANMTDGACAFTCAYDNILTGDDLTNLLAYINDRFGTST